MNNQEIIDNAPPNTSIVDSEFKFFDDIYCELNEEGEWNWKNAMPKYPIRSLADIKRIVELEKELEKQLKPDLFWPENEGEIGFDDAHEAIGSMVDDYGAILGSMFTLDRAVKLSSQTYVLTEFDESTGSFEYEALKEPKT
jgi:hypothetical protein